jgi:hypothetical protein
VRATGEAMDAALSAHGVHLGKISFAGQSKLRNVSYFVYNWHSKVPKLGGSVKAVQSISFGDPAEMLTVTHLDEPYAPTAGP